MSFLKNANFANGAAPWVPFNHAESIAFTIGGVAESPFSGGGFLRFQTSVSGGSMAVDFDAFNSNGYLPHQWITTVGAVLYVRACPGVGSVSGTVAFWELKSRDPNYNNPTTAFHVSENWTPLFLCIDLGNIFLPRLRLEIYLDTLNAGLDVGAVWIA